MKRFLFGLLFTFLFVVPVITFAQDPIVPCNGVDCNTCHFVELGNNLIKWLIGAMVSICAIVVVVGGLRMVTAGGDVGALESAKGLIWNALIGFVILLAAWLIVDTVLKVFLEGATNASPGGTDAAQIEGYGPWNEIECVAPPVVTSAPGDSGTAVPGQLGTAATGGLTQAQVQAQLGGIKVLSSGSCSDRTNKSCTSLEGIQQGALTEIIGTINTCTGCNLVITAGTEVGHTNPCHQNGTCVDIKCAGGCTPEQVLQVKNSAVANGSRVDYETLDCAKAAAARLQGVNAHCKTDPNYGHITGEHFSLYTQ